MYLEGQIISGEFDQETQVFSLKKVKNFYTETSLKENQVGHLYNYLKLHEGDTDGQIVTLYDQMLVRLSSEEVKVLIGELERIQSMY
ncbi:hypothetical protein JOC77_000558 [Peribacillus deserti]|uniref:Uncharacterized protein n=1 Tax=Peribacillus deserti TaxID=673318 RepID=A0ABS2QDD5_9BACI|nr:hypothetical protein [Peribacillus deserti]MBM7691153.1 hypothetical protein [Peribacillus deserti]